MLTAANGKPDLRGRLALADCCDLPFRTGVFSLVLCSFALAHIRNLERVVQEVARVTSASADVYVSDLHPCAYEHGWKTAFRDQDGPAEIDTWPRSLDQQLAAWSAGGFRCAQSISAWLDQWEMSILAQAGKAHRFEEVRHVPAIQILHFKPQPRNAAEEKPEPSMCTSAVISKPRPQSVA
jgi:ubiquinone/menaquinone biosynthesis C-methylase UbiE